MLTILPQQFLEKIISFLNECKGPNFDQEYFEKNTQFVLNYYPKLGRYKNSMVLTIFANALKVDGYEITIEIEKDNTGIIAQITDCSEAVKIKDSENYLSSKTTSEEFIPDIKEYEPELANALGW